MAAFGAILDDKLDAPAPAWTWRPVLPPPLLDAVAGRGPFAAAAYAPFAAPAARVGRRFPARPRPPRLQRTLTPAQAAALAVMRHLGARTLDRAFTRDDLKKAYRQLAHRHHPDRIGGGDGAAFRSLHAAYRILSAVE